MSKAGVISIADYLNQTTNNLTNSVQNKVNNEVSPELNEQGEQLNMKGITLRKDGRYAIRKMVNGKVVTKYARTLKEAQKIYVQIKKYKFEQVPEKVYTVKMWCEEWLKLYKEPFLKPESLKEIKIYIEKINQKFGKEKIKEITTNMLQLYFNKLEKTRTKEKLYVYFNALMQKAEDLSMIAKNPFKGVIKEKKLKQKNFTFSFEEQKKILEALKNKDIEKEIYIYLLSGCRPGELPPSENFDFENNIITINGTKMKMLNIGKLK